MILSTEMRALWTAVLMLTTLAGCNSPTETGPTPDESTEGIAVGGVSLNVSRTAYRHGDNASVQLRNQSSQTIGYNSCTAAREYWTGSTWQRIESLRLCTGALYPLPVGQSVSFEEPVTAEWTAGTYRIVLRVNRSDSNAMLDLATRTFTVAP